MIKIKATANSIKVKGHADSKPKGQDLVCAGVSAIVMSSISWFKKNEIQLIVDDSIPLIEITLINKSIKNKQFIKLITMQLKELAKSNKKYIAI